MSQEEGYLYCISNEYMPGILKIGKTSRTPESRLKEANSCTWAFPAFRIEFAKKVKDVHRKEKLLHRLLEQYTERVLSRREFFRISIEEVRAFFDFTDGEMWISSKDQSHQKTRETSHAEEDQEFVEEAEEAEEAEESEEAEEEHEEEAGNQDCLSENAKNSKSKRVIGCRDMAKCFTHEQLISHKIGITHTWFARYDSNKNKLIMENGDEYRSLNQMVIAHYKQERPNRVENANAWKECECQLDNGTWITTMSLPEITCHM
jgi:hypothetical protein